MIPNEIRFYGLLYIDEQNNKDHSGQRCGVDPIDIYIMCASLSSKTFRAMGSTLHLIANKGEYVRRRLARLNLDDLAVLDHDFFLMVLKKILFYSAHFKLDVLKAFGLGQFGERIGLIDLDTVLLRRLPGSAGLAVYDISDQVFSGYPSSPLGRVAYATQNQESGTSHDRARSVQ